MHQKQSTFQFNFKHCCLCNFNTFTVLCIHLDTHHGGSSLYENRLGSQSVNLDLCIIWYLYFRSTVFCIYFNSTVCDNINKVVLSNFKKLRLE